MSMNMVIPSSNAEVVKLTCQKCGVLFDWECPGRKDIPKVLFAADGKTLCFVPGCCKGCLLTTLQPKTDWAAQRWLKLCPPMYQNTEVERLPNLEVSSNIIGWEYQSKGLLIHGATGTGKTRTVWLLIRQLLKAGKLVTAYDCTEFGQKVREKFMDGHGAEIEWMKWLVDVDVFMLDDLGKEKLTDRVAEQLHALLEKRSAAMRPTIFTTEFMGVALEQRFAERGAAFVRRLREYCDCVGLG